MERGNSGIAASPIDTLNVEHFNTAIRNIEQVIKKINALSLLQVQKFTKKNKMVIPTAII